MKAFKNKNIYDKNSDTINVIGKTEFLSNDPSSLKADHATLGFFYESFKRGINVDSPNPTNIQNIALAILPVTAISPNPFLVIAIDALKSARQFPQQRRVKAKNLGCNDKTNPRFVSKSIMMFETNAIHDTDCIKAMNAKKNITFFEA